MFWSFPVVNISTIFFAYNRVRSSNFYFFTPLPFQTLFFGMIDSPHRLIGNATGPEGGEEAQRWRHSTSNWAEHEPPARKGSERSHPEVGEREVPHHREVAFPSQSPCGHERSDLPQEIVGARSSLTSLPEPCPAGQVDVDERQAVSIPGLTHTLCDRFCVVGARDNACVVQRGKHLRPVPPSSGFRTAIGFTCVREGKDTQGRENVAAIKLPEQALNVDSPCHSHV